MREFETGATRDTDDGKLDYEGFYSPLVMRRYAEYMDKNRVQADGAVRDSDNWQKGIPQDAYIKSAWRHFIEWWTLWRKAKDEYVSTQEIETAVCALLFNVMGWLHEHLKVKGYPNSIHYYPKNSSVTVLNGDVWIGPNPQTAINEGETT